MTDKWEFRRLKRASRMGTVEYGEVMFTISENAQKPFGSVGHNGNAVGCELMQLHTMPLLKLALYRWRVRRIHRRRQPRST